MKILVAPQEFKGTLSAHEAAAAIADGFRQALPDAEVLELPLSDGGPGFVECLVEALNGEYAQSAVTGPLGGQVLARWGLVTAAGEPGVTAVLELASAAGLSLVPAGGLRPLDATTYGVGELIWHALSAGATRICLGVGGSATTDGGAGILQALGARLLDDAGNLAPGGGPLTSLARLDLARLDRRLAGTELLVATDVRNPLSGPDGAAAVYGPQKGASPQQVELLDAGLRRWAEVLEQVTGHSVDDLPGAGAAGGAAAGLVACCGARIVSGFDLVAEAVGLAAHLAWADVAVTGEGRFDSQSLQGKVTGRLAEMARAQDKRCVVLAGRVDGRAPGLEAHALVPDDSLAGAAELTTLAARFAREL
jgi:glycerate kinase